MPKFFDSHCHIHEASNVADDGGVAGVWQKGGFTSTDQLINESIEAGVTHLLCVGCSLEDSRMAIELAQKNAHCFASIGIHPHEAKVHRTEAIKSEFASLATQDRVVAVGECGLDYFYDHSPKSAQIEMLEFQLDIAQQHGLPLVFHVREAFEDFWPIFDNFKHLRGVLHSFTSNRAVLDKALSRGLYVGLNGIMTFTKNSDQIDMARSVPLSKLLLETDAPFLTPTPYRGTICQPKHVVVTAEYLSDLRDEFLEEIAAATTQNAKELFRI